MKPASQDKVFIREAARTKSLDRRSVLLRRSTGLRLNYLIDQTGAPGGGCVIPVTLRAEASGIFRKEQQHVFQASTQEATPQQPK